MENAPSSSQHSSEVTINTDLIQRVLDSGTSLLAAYTPEGHTILQEERSNRQYRQLDREWAYQIPDIAFANWHRSTQGASQEQTYLHGAGIYEVAVMVPLEKDIMATRTVIDSGGILGIGRKTHQERYVETTQPMTIGEAKDGTAGGEPAIVLYYYAEDKGASQFEDRVFRDLHGRPGNFLCTKIVMPKSLSELISEEIRKNPRFIRELIDTLVRQKYSRSFVENSWNHYAKPPYEKWDQRPNRLFYFADLVKNPQARQLPLTQAINNASSY